LKGEAVDRTLWITRFGRGYGPIVRQTTVWMNETCEFATHWCSYTLIRLVRYCAQ
jgi:hypothetical protein